MGINDLLKLGKLLGGWIGKNSPTLLTWMAVGGIASTTISAVPATQKAIAIIDDEVWKRYEESGSKEEFPEWLGLDTKTYTWKDTTKLLTKWEVFKLCWKCFIPTAAFGLTTMVCIIGANSINMNRNAAIAGLYTLTETAFKEYKNKVVETVGRVKEQKVCDEICQDRIRDNPIGENNVIFTGKGEVLCYDSISGRYFKSDIEKIRRAINKLNMDLMSEMFISLNEFYGEIGLPNIRIGYDNGWNMENGLIDVTFSAQLTETDEPCLSLNYEIVSRHI